MNPVGWRGCALSHPPLACRPSPPQGWRLADIDDGISPGALAISESGNHSPISTLVGEMAGRPEGGITAPMLSIKAGDPSPSW
ncbi:hypothetical protein C5748_12325 [Phyllobacterium phragmitis]|uniref:Lytic murein transglycosylase n=1 Tax=Phyllobacterium phragmitis TaxID=2670329 RepID=A0A2S9IRS2_9HYPH|nr:hypothetical protein C5748_12325 [Phyllobacterium phragmitis]